MLILYLSGGIFLGWSLGANDAANIFGTAVGTRMVKFRTAALISSVFVIIGAVLEGSGTSQTLVNLGTIDTLQGAFIVTFTAGITVTAMTKLSIPVSTSQAIIGAIIGWNIFSGQKTDVTLLSNIVLTWVLSPIIAAGFAIMLYYPLKHFVENSKIHLLTIDAYTRTSLIIAGAVGAYTLGANNIANVVGVFIPSAPFREFSIGSITITVAHQLFLLGGLAISFGIISYSQRVMRTVGKDLFHLSPVTALIVVISHSMVLYIFASQGLSNFLISISLPPVPLVPVSSSQAVIGAIIGIAVAKGSRNIKLGVLAKIASGWVITPIIAFLISLGIFTLLQYLS